MLGAGSATCSSSQSPSRAASTISIAPSTRSPLVFLASIDAWTGPLTNTAVVRYDAYEGTGGQQSASVALLDATRTGTVLTAIQGRDYARIYAGLTSTADARRSRSPEEQEAVDRAMAR